MIGRYEELLRKLEALYGAFDANSHRFAKSSNTEIARHLGYSDAQFSRLIHEHATKGEYERAVQNVGRILLIRQLEDKLKKRGISKTKKWQLYTSYAITIASLAMVAAIFLRGTTSVEDNAPPISPSGWHAAMELRNVICQPLCAS